MGSTLSRASHFLQYTLMLTKCRGIDGMVRVSPRRGLEEKKHNAQMDPGIGNWNDGCVR